MTICSKCGKELDSHSFQGIQFEICTACGAIALNQANIEEISKRIELKKDIINLFNLPAVNVEEAGRNCCKCSNKMDKVYHEGVLLDRCKDCGLIFFDNGELSRFFNLFSRYNLDIVSNAQFLKKFCTQKQTQIQKPELRQHYEPTALKIVNKEVEYEANSTSGWAVLALMIIGAMIALVCLFTPFTAILSGFILLIGLFCLGGFKIVKPQEAYVLVLFGKYVGTLKKTGFHWVNPFSQPYAGNSFGAVSLKARTLDNGKQKINDAQGNPIDVGIIVVWEVKDTAKAIFNVEDYPRFLSAQADCALRNIVRMYPYDAPDEANVQSLRGDSAEISDKLKTEIQKSVTAAGINVIDARITHLAYSTEIAVAMLQRQQAHAVIDAKRAIVDGAVGMVEMALDKLSQNEHIHLDEATKANMVNNLLVVLCANKDSQPVISNNIH